MARAGGGEKSVTIIRADGPQDEAPNRATMRRGAREPGMPRADGRHADGPSRAKSWRAGKEAAGGKPFVKRPPKQADDRAFAKPAHGKRKERT